MSETEPTPNTDPTPPGNDPSQLPEWARKAIEKANGEAASYRTKLRDVETKLSSAKSQEDIDAATKELRESNSKLARDLLVATAGEGLPKELRELLKGDTEAELLAHAETLRKFVPAGTPAPPAPPTNLGGGLDPSKNDPKDIDPDDFADNWRSGKISRASVSGYIQ